MPRRIRLDPTVLHPEAKRLKTFLEARFIGQPRAVSALIEKYDYFLSSLWRPRKPIVCFLEMGPSGSGKTHLAELLALYFFGSMDALTKVECGSYAAEHEVSKLIGAPPGYIGSNKSTIISQDKIDHFAWTQFFENLYKRDAKYRRLLQEVASARITLESNTSKDKTVRDALTEVCKEKQARLNAYAQSRVQRKMFERRTPRSIILFDEIEKANRTIHNFLLEVTAKGRARLASGEEVDFTRSFIIETSNVGSEQIAKIAKGRMGIGFGELGRNEEKTDRGIYDAALRQARKVFTTEYLARHTKIVFRLLAPEELRQILEISIREFFKVLREEGFALGVIIPEEVKQFILNEALDHPENGARLLAEKVDRYLVEPVSRIMNSGQISKKSAKLYVDLENKEGEQMTVFSAENGNGEKVELIPPIEKAE